MMEGGKYVQYGCGPFSSPEGWINFDASAKLRLQLLPGVGRLIAQGMPVAFAHGIRYGDILTGLPDVPDGSCRGVYCSHVLEHFSYEDCQLALANTYRMLQRGGIFRCIVSDLEWAARQYIQGLEQQDPGASTLFMEETMLGRKTRTSGLKSFVEIVFGNKGHQYMWDQLSLTHVLKQVGFKNIRPCAFNDSDDAMFYLVEEEERFQRAVAIEAIR